MLKIAPDFRPLPLDAVTQTFGILAVRGAGKSNAAVVLAEEMHKAKLHWVAIDPKGDWWGVRSSADGKGPGLPVVIFGGLKGDVPLEPSAGAFIADLIVDESITCVLDVSEFSEGEKIKFLAGSGSQEGFATRLFRRKNREQEPTHLFCEEADDYIPQKPFREQAKLVHVFQKLVKMGRQKGLGATIISQRSARVNKDVLTQIETLIALRTMSPQDRKAIGDWIEFHAASKTALESLSTLEDGEAWFWSPHWLKTFERIRFRRRETYDSGSTPAAGGNKNQKHRRAPAMLADVDLAAIKSQMAETIERAKADDPRLLRQRIAELERQLAAAEQLGAKAIEIPVITEEDRELIATLGSTFRQASIDIKDYQPEFQRLIASLDRARCTGSREPLPKNGRVLPRYRAEEYGALPAKGNEKAKSGPAPTQSNGELGNSGKRRMLIALAQNPEGLTDSKLALLTGISKKGGTWSTYLGWLRGNDYIEKRGGVLVITELGFDVLGDYEPLPTGRALIDYWRGELGDSGMRRMLDALVEVYPRALSRDELGQRTEISPAGGTFSTYLGKLKTLELVVGSSSELRASHVLFE